ncbi:MAG: Ldh family oxidoreductase [Rhizobiales bacterium]|nr:Ldh family oxidoreductase [Hyphomicrobiales bacterium]
MRIERQALHRFICNLLETHDAGERQAAAVARHMVWCEMAGRGNFGIERLPILVKRIKAGVLAANADMAWERLEPSLARLDAGGGFGYDAAERAMSEAIAMAKAGGIGVVGVTNSNFFGAGAYYANQAAAAGMIGIAMSNSFPKVVAPDGLRPTLGTNPLAFGAPRQNGRHLLFDMATSALAGSTVREAIAKGTLLPEGLAIDSEGKSITDPAKVAEGALLPLGGAKGFGLALMVEVLAGLLTGAGVGEGVTSMYNDFSRSGDNGHFLMALDIGRWINREKFEQRLEMLATAILASGPGTRLPGEQRWDNYARAEREGIELDPTQWDAVVKLAQAAGIDLGC